MYYLSHRGMWRQEDLDFEEDLEYTVRLCPKSKAARKGSLERLCKEDSRRKDTAECVRFKSKVEEYLGCKGLDSYKDGRTERRDDGGKIDQDLIKTLWENLLFYFILCPCDKVKYPTKAI